MKTVFTNSRDTINAFVGGNFEARCSNIKSYENGVKGSPTCYSYGTHYPLIIKRYTSNGVFWFLNVSGYSVTTSKHIAQARYALFGKNKIDIEQWFLAESAIDCLTSECKRYYDLASRARTKKEHYKSIAINLFSNYENYQRINLDVEGLLPYELTEERCELIDKKITELIKGDK